MSRGPGALQRRILGALWSRGESDCYDIGALSDLFPRHFLEECTVLRARWRWYTIDLLDLVAFGEPRSHRVSAHRAVRSLARAHRVQIVDQCPYDDPFLAEVDYYGNQFGGLDLAEVTQYVDPRWPGRQGRCLWFRLPPPMTESVPDDDQLIQLEALQEGIFPEAFDEFTGTVDRRKAWESDAGRYLRWLLCGSSAAS
ncbi:hypothetical protein JCM12141A_63830 [Mycolicibacterium hodleri]